MIHDLDTVDGSTSWTTTVCIVGAGVAGISIALELERMGVECVLLESGGFDREASTSALNDGACEGLPYAFDEGTRCRYLGGSSNCWGGCCRPFEPIDFEKRPWVPHSGWPIAYADLASWYARAGALLDIPQTDYDPDDWIPGTGSPRFRRLRLPGGDVEDRVFVFSPPTRFGKRYRDALARARRIRVLLHANATSFEASPDGRVVHRVFARSLNGRSASIAATHVVLAAGGVENIRLMLHAGRARPDTFARPGGRVGRYFMDHPRLCAGRVRFTTRAAHPLLYDQLYYLLARNRHVAPGGARFGGHLVLSPEAQRRERVLNAQTWFRSFAPGERAPATRALMRLRLRSTGAQFGDITPWADLRRIARDPLPAAGFAITRGLRATSLVREVRLNTIVEPEPDPDSRVELDNATDALGMQRARIRWTLGPLVRRTFDRTWAVVATALERSGIASVELPEPIEHRDWVVPARTDFLQVGLGKLLDQDDGWPRLPDWTWHHMGGTRMSESPADGVVDRDLRVHGMENLWICGGSVFPTAGANFPTMTIAALALRLAAHLADRCDGRAARAVEVPAPTDALP